MVVSADNVPQVGAPIAFINRSNDTIIPYGKYYYSISDTLKTFAIVYDSNSNNVGIDRNGNLLFEVFRFDNGPDYIREGLFRVIRNGKIGFANALGEMAIACQFDCAYYFEGGKAKVSNNCNSVQDGEHEIWESDDWFYIDISGKRI